MRFVLACIALAPSVLACASSPICEGRSLRIIEPDDGESVPAGDVNVVVEVCDFEMDEVITLRVIEPFESDWAFITVDDPDQRLYGVEVPTVPGMTLELVALAADGTRSSPVSIDVADD